MKSTPINSFPLEKKFERVRQAYAKKFFFNFLKYYKRTNNVLSIAIKPKEEYAINIRFNKINDEDNIKELLTFLRKNNISTKYASSFCKSLDKIDEFIYNYLLLSTYKGDFKKYSEIPTETTIHYIPKYIIHEIYQISKENAELIVFYNPLKIKKENYKRIYKLHKEYTYVRPDLSREGLISKHGSYMEDFDTYRNFLDFLFLYDIKFLIPDNNRIFLPRQKINIDGDGSLSYFTSLNDEVPLPCLLDETITMNFLEIERFWIEKVLGFIERKNIVKKEIIIREGDTISFKENSILYSFDFQAKKGIPTDISFEICGKISINYENRIILIRGKGYGDPHNYGNGRITVDKEKLLESIRDGIAIYSCKKEEK